MAASKVPGAGGAVAVELYKFTWIPEPTVTMLGQASHSCTDVSKPAEVVLKLAAIPETTNGFRKGNDDASFSLFTRRRDHISVQNGRCALKKHIHQTNKQTNKSHNALIESKTGNTVRRNTDSAAVDRFISMVKRQ